MQRYKYILAGLEDMGQYIIRLLDGTELPLEKATIAQVAKAVSIIRDKELLKKP